MVFGIAIGATKRASRSRGRAAFELPFGRGDAGAGGGGGGAGAEGGRKRNADIDSNCGMSRSTWNRGMTISAVSAMAWIARATQKRKRLPVLGRTAR
jgi:hypothetical protein